MNYNSLLNAANGPLVVRLPNRGEWTSAPYSYLRNLHVDGRAVAHDADGVMPVPRELLADGRLDISDDLVVQPYDAPKHARRRLLPYRTDTYVFAFVTNTLVRLAVDNRRHPARGRAGCTGTGRDHGYRGSCARRDGPGHARHRSRTLGPRARLHRTVHRCRHTYRPWTGDQPAAGLGSAAVRLHRGHIAHELLHDWLGSHLQGDASVVWLYEGFTEYLGNWHGTAAGLFTRDRFADRILSFEREARTQSSLGRVAFADSSINWRDSDGPNEIMAYKGGALLAFVLDVELRRRCRRRDQWRSRDRDGHRLRGTSRADRRPSR